MVYLAEAKPFSYGTLCRDEPPSPPSDQSEITFSDSVNAALAVAPPRIFTNSNGRSTSVEEKAVMKEQDVTRDRWEWVTSELDI